MSNEDLLEGYRVFLGKPVGAFPADGVYGLYCWDEFLGETALAGGLDVWPEPYARCVDQESEWPHAFERWPVDVGRSLIQYQGRELTELPESVQRSHFGKGLVRVPRVQELLSNPVTSGERQTLVSSFVARVITDGTLLDAIRAATFTHGPPDKFVTKWEDYAELEPEYETAFDGIADERVRRNFHALAVNSHTARSFGGAVLDVPYGMRRLVEHPELKLLAGWGFGEGQAGSGVFQLTGKTAERDRAFDADAIRAFAQRMIEAYAPDATATVDDVPFRHHSILSGALDLLVLHLADGTFGVIQSFGERWTFEQGTRENVLASVPDTIFDDAARAVMGSP